MYKVQHNFVTPLNITEKNHSQQAIDSLHILQYCINFIKDNVDVKPFRQIASVELRKLLCEEQNSSILSLSKNPKYLSLGTEYTKISAPNMDDMYCLLVENAIPKHPQYMSMSKWLAQKIIYFDRKAEDMPKIFDGETFIAITDLLYGSQKEHFRSFFRPCTYDFKGEIFSGFERISSNDEKHSAEIFKILNNVGYNSVDVRKTIKLIANKQGAHTATAHPLGLLHLDIDKKSPIVFDIIICRVIETIKELINE